MGHQKERSVFVKCQFSRGGFPTELIFQVESPGGGVLRGVAPVEYCFDNDRKPLGKEILGGKKVPGYVAGIALGPAEKKGSVRVNLPDGAIYDISNDQITDVKDSPHVLLES